MYTIRNTSANWKSQRVNKGEIVELILYPELDRNGQEYNTDKNRGSDKTQLHHCVDIWWVQQASYLPVHWWNQGNVSPDWYVTKIFTVLCFLQYATDRMHRAQHITHKTRESSIVEGSSVDNRLNIDYAHITCLLTVVEQSVRWTEHIS
jgi:hypothetical protein